MHRLGKARLRHASSAADPATLPISVFHTNLRRREMPNQRGDAPKRESGMKPPRRKAPGTKGEIQSQGAAMSAEKLGT